MDSLLQLVLLSNQKPKKRVFTLCGKCLIAWPFDIPTTILAFTLIDRHLLSSAYHDLHAGQKVLLILSRFLLVELLYLECLC